MMISDGAPTSLKMYIVVTMAVPLLMCIVYLLCKREQDTKIPLMILILVVMVLSLVYYFKSTGWWNFWLLFCLLY